jgi:hypothetical protein
MKDFKIVGKKIKKIRKMTQSELDFHGWEDRGHTFAIVLEDNTLIYPSQDGEGNGPGVIFIDAKGNKKDGYYLDENL